MTERTMSKKRHEVGDTGMTVGEIRAGANATDKGWAFAGTFLPTANVILALLDALEAAQAEAEEAKKEKDVLRADLDRFQGRLNFVTQTKLHDPENGVLGNCFAACIASMMGDSISDIPAFEEMPNDGSEDDWLNRFWEFAESKGLAAIRLSGDVRLDMRYIANGYSGRTKDGFRVRHSCVYQCGRLAFDPHPSGDGLEAVDSVWVFVWLPPRIRKAVERAEKAEALLADARKEAETLRDSEADKILHMSPEQVTALSVAVHGIEKAAFAPYEMSVVAEKAIADHWQQRAERAEAQARELYKSMQDLSLLGSGEIAEREEIIERALADFEGGGE